MTHDGIQEGFIKEVRPPYVLIWITIICFGAVLLFALLLIGPPRGRHPEWAPDGCTVYRDYREAPGLTIMVDDIKDFDTEEECAAVILDALHNAAYYLNGEGSRGIFRNPVYIQYPRIDGEIPILRFYKIVNVNNFVQENYEALELVGVPENFLDDEMSLDKLKQIRDGELHLGFLDQLDFNTEVEEY